MKRVSILAAGVLSSAIIPGDGWALGLGELTLHSNLNEPFRAEVAVLESDAFDDSDVLVGLASEVKFERLGVSQELFLNRINFQVESECLRRKPRCESLILTWLSRLCGPTDACCESIRY